MGRLVVDRDNAVRATVPARAALRLFGLVGGSLELLGGDGRPVPRFNGIQKRTGLRLIRLATCSISLRLDRSSTTVSVVKMRKLIWHRRIA